MDVLWRKCLPARRRSGRRPDRPYAKEPGGLAPKGRPVERSDRTVVLASAWYTGSWLRYGTDSSTQGGCPRARRTSARAGGSAVAGARRHATSTGRPLRAGRGGQPSEPADPTRWPPHPPADPTGRPQPGNPPARTHRLRPPHHLAIPPAGQPTPGDPPARRPTAPTAPGPRRRHREAARL